MGFFSWKTQDTNESIANSSSCRKTFTVYLLDNKGNKWKEENYEGYGKFGGVDYYDLLAKMNGKVGRGEGIDLAFSGDTNILWPNLIKNPNWVWINEEPERCEYQGFFYDDEEDNED